MQREKVGLSINFVSSVTLNFTSLPCNIIGRPSALKILMFYDT